MALIARRNSELRERPVDATVTGDSADLAPTPRSGDIPDGTAMLCCPSANLSACRYSRPVLSFAHESR